MSPQQGSSNDAAPDSRRSSLRRLSSIASLTNFFARRRSTNITDHTTASSSSNLSLSSTGLSNPQLTKVGNTSTSTLQEDDVVSELQAPLAVHAPRRSSYICLPDDPIGGMPRSRTFSNLPLPSRTKKPTSMVPSKSHSRIPSTLLPPSRLPSPQMSTRKYSHNRLTSAETKIPLVQNRMKRSDTEPLLGLNAQPSHPPRSTAFKENISLSPVKPVPALDRSEYTDSHQAHASLHSGSAPWEITDDISEPFHPPFHKASSSWSINSNHATLTGAREYKSSPVQRSVRDRRPTPLAPFQRFNSQPVLLTTRRESQHHEIKQTRLVPVCQPSTPQPPSETPLAPIENGSTIHRKKTKDVTPEARQHLDQTPGKSLFTGRKQQPISFSSPSQRDKVLEIHGPQAPGYWAGRLSALLDRFRNEELTAQLNEPLMSPKSQMDKMHSTDAAHARIIRVFEHLHVCCRNQDAKDSLTFFQCQYADTMQMPELRKLTPIVLGSSKSATNGNVVSPAKDGGGIGESRKMSFMNRLLGRPKRKSLGPI